MSAERNLIERLVCSGSVTLNGEVIRVLYDPLTYSNEGLDDRCFFCGATPTWDGKNRGATHEAKCAWVEAMAYLGHPLPEKHFAAGAPSVKEGHK